MESIRGKMFSVFSANSKEYFFLLKIAWIWRNYYYIVHLNSQKITFYCMMTPYIFVANTMQKTVIELICKVLQYWIYFLSLSPSGYHLFTSIQKSFSIHWYFFKKLAKTLWWLNNDAVGFQCIKYFVENCWKILHKFNIAG